MSFSIKHVKVAGVWYWVCSCGKLLAPVKEEGTNAGRHWLTNFQAKGAASKHLMTHNKNLVKHGQTIDDSIYKFHKFKLTNAEKISLLQNKTIQVERKGLQPQENLAIDQEGKSIGRIHINNEIMLTIEKYPNQNSVHPKHEILTITLIKEE